jgi:hypothetical protein
MGDLFSFLGTSNELTEAIPHYSVDSHGMFLYGYPVQNTANLEYDLNQPYYPYNMRAAVEASIDNNPYSDAYWRSCEDELDAMSTRIDDFKAIVDQYSTTDDYESFIIKASELFSSYGIDMSDNVADEVAAFESITDDGYQRAVTMHMAKAVAMNNVESTWFGVGLGNIAAQRRITIDDFATKLFMQAKRDKSMFLLESAKLMMNMRMSHTEYFKQIMAMHVDREKLAMVHRTEKVQKDFDYYLNDVLWAQERIKSSLNSLSTLGGIPTMEKGPSKSEQAVAAALTVGPSIGQMVGMGGGGLAGGLIAGGIGAGVAFLGTLLF